MDAARWTVLPVLGRSPRFVSWDIAQRSEAPSSASRPVGDVAWIHAASLGEAKLAGTFLAALSGKHPQQRYVLTATTRAGLEYLRTFRSDRTVCIRLLPLDSIRLMEQVLDSYAIARVWLMETEFWPSMMWVCRARGIPVGVINARLEQKSFGRYRRMLPVLAPLFMHLDPVLAQTSTYADRFRLLGVKSGALHVTGNLKSYITIAAMSPADRTAKRRALGIGETDIVVTAGCVHPGEGMVVRQAMDALHARGVEARCIVVPRHLKALPQIASELGPDVLRLPEPATDHTWRMCMIEKFGILVDMYGIADAAVVGGTFIPVGGHSMWDAARFGLPVIFGPYYHTQQESAVTLLDAGVGFSVLDGATLATRIQDVLTSGKAAVASSALRLSATMQEKQRSLEAIVP